MKLKIMLAATIAGALALPLTQHASAQAGGPAGASAVGTGPTGGSPQTGGPGPEAASAGEPLDFTENPIRGFATVDANNDGEISPAEWENYTRPGREGTNTGRNVARGMGPTNERDASRGATIERRQR